MMNRALSRRAKSGIPLMRRSYWNALNTVLDKAGGPVKSSSKLHGKPWMKYPIGRRHFGLYPGMHIKNREIRVALYIQRDSAKPFFQLLHEQKGAVEQDLGYRLEWEERPDLRDSRIVAYLNDVDPTDRQDWPCQHEWLATHLNDLHRVFADRVRNLGTDPSLG